MSCRGLVRLLGCLAGIAVALPAASAAAQSLRFTTTAPGGIVGTGNTLGLSKALNANGPGIEDSIGTFISLGNTVDDVPLNTTNPWPTGTTYDWTKNGSSAVLGLPGEAKVLYAELLWGGSTKYGTEDVIASLDAPVMLSTGALSIAVVPDPATALTIAQTAATGFLANYYMRSADVTALVQTAGAGTYSVSGVPATEATTINSLNAAGWTLVVAYRNQSEPTRNLSVFVGGSFVDENSQQDYTISGFCAPPVGVVQGDVVVSAIEGDASLVGDQLLIATSDVGPFVNLSGPNNPTNNFFCSQLNDSAGQLDKSGTFGTANHDALTGTNVPGGRQSWDVTTVPLTSDTGQLENGQTGAVIRTITTGDSYVPILAAFAIDVNAPDFTGTGATLVTSADAVVLGDTLTVTATIANQGEVTAQGLVVKMPFDSGLSLTSFQTDGAAGDINGGVVDGTALASGVTEGDLPTGQQRQIVMTFSVVAAPTTGTYILQPTWSYSFEVCTGGAPQLDSFTQIAVVQFDAAASSSSSAVSSSSTAGAGGAASASTAASTSAATGGGIGGSGAMPSSATGSAVGGEGATSGAVVSAGDTSTDSGCGCVLPGRAPGAPLPLVALAGFALAIARRLRRRRAV